MVFHACGKDNGMNGIKYGNKRYFYEDVCGNSRQVQDATAYGL
jgi:hypothetical protein